MYIKADDSRILWEGVISLEKNNGSVTPWRIPHEDRDLFPNEVFHNMANHASGVRVLLKTDSRNIRISGDPVGAGYEVAPYGCQIDLCIDNKIVQTQVFENNELLFAGLPEGMNIVELWLSPGYPITIRGIELDDGASLEKFEDKRLKWITYGSSITHCVRAASPAMTWPAIVARTMNFNLTCLGYGGQCKVDSMVARMIRDMDADFISLKLGINVHGGDLSPRTFVAAVIGSIAIIREKHKTAPLVVCSPIYSPPREDTPSIVGNTLVNMRNDVKKAVESFRKRGDKNIYYVDGLKIFGPELTEYLPDKLHPDARGMELMAENFVHEVFKKHKISLTA
ncbi:MAG: SGNH/GDSL hydrolase family protein [Victivallaceae bacterium]|nr:SGNH/GDSL hydrolase family protein [Victivallaceae bacterium]